MGRIDESRRRRFEAARLAGDDAPIRSFLPPEGDDAFQATLEELVLIDMEFRVEQWRRDGDGEAPTLVDYADEFPRLADPETHARLETELDAMYRESSSVDRRIDRYVLREHVGAGAFADVWRAHDPRLDRDVALKIPKDAVGSDPRLLERVRREASAAGGLDHPGVVSVHAVGEHEGRPFYVSEYVAGATLAVRLANDPLGPDDAARIVASVADAVAYAHGQGVVHRDIKPSNILMHPVRGPVLADFGLAHLAASANALTQEGELLGTPSYMAPEQAAGRTRDVDARTDVYALGVVLYEALSGRRPFDRASSAGTIHAVLSEDPPPVGSGIKGLPLDLETICLKAMARERDRRYASAGALAEDLRRYLERRPVAARRTGLAGRLALWVRRRPAVAGLTAAGLVGVAAAAAWGYLGIRAERDQLRIEQGNTRRHLHLARVSEADAVIKAKQAGWPQRALSSLREAAALDVERDVVALRNLTIPALCPMTPTLSVVSESDAVDGPATHVALDRRGGRAVGVTSKGTLWVRRLGDGAVQARTAVNADDVVGLVVHPSGAWALVAHADGTLASWSLDPLARTAESKGEAAVAIAIHPTGDALAIAHDDGQVSIRSCATDGLGPILQVLEAHTGPCRALAFDVVDHRLLGTGGDDRRLRIWNWRLGTLLHEERTNTDGVDAIAGRAGTFAGTVPRSWAPLTTGLGRSGIQPFHDWMHGARIRALHASHGDPWIVSVSVDGSIAVWGLAGRRVLISESGRRGRVVATAQAPEDQTLLTAHEDGRCVLWRVGGGAAVRWSSHQGCAFRPGTHDLLTDAGVWRHGPDPPDLVPLRVASFPAVAVDRERGVLVAVRDDGLVVEHEDTEPFDVVRSTPIGMTKASCAVLAGDRLWIGSATGTLWIGQRRDGGFDGTVHDLASGAIARLVLEAPEDGSERVLALTEGGLLRVDADGRAEPRDQGARRTTAIATAPGRIAFSRPGAGVVLRDTTGATPDRVFADHDHPIDGVHMLAGGTLVASSDASELLLRDVVGGHVPVRATPRDPPWGWIEVDPEGRVLLTGSGSILVDQTRWVGTVHQGARDGAISGDGKTLFVSRRHGGLWAWPASVLERPGAAQMGSAAELRGGHPISPAGHGHSVWDVAASPDGRWFATCDNLGAVILWDAERRVVAHHLAPPSPDAVAWRVAFSPDSRRLAAGINERVHLFDVATGQETARFDGDGALVVGLAFHPKQPRVVSTSFFRRKTPAEPLGALRVWDLDTGRSVTRLLFSETIPRDVRFSPDGRRLALACSDGSVRLFDPSRLTGAGAEPADVLQPHPTEAYAAAFNASGTLLATGGADGRVVLHDAQSLERLCELQATSNIRAIAFSHDDRFLAASAYAAPSMSWDLGRIRQAFREMGIDWDDVPPPR